MASLPTKCARQSAAVARLKTSTATPAVMSIGCRNKRGVDMFLKKQPISSQWRRIANWIGAIATLYWISEVQAGTPQFYEEMPELQRSQAIAVTTELANR